MKYDLEKRKEELLDELINTLYEVTEDSCDIQRMDEILAKLEKIDPDSFEPFSVEESYQRFMERFKKMEVSGELQDLSWTEKTEKK